MGQVTRKNGERCHDAELLLEFDFFLYGSINNHREDK